VLQALRHQKSDESRDGSGEHVDRLGARCLLLNEPANVFCRQQSPGRRLVTEAESDQSSNDETVGFACGRGETRHIGDVSVEGTKPPHTLCRVLRCRIDSATRQYFKDSRHSTGAVVALAAGVTAKLYRVSSDSFPVDVVY
jgi:hypothetical protein